MNKLAVWVLRVGVFGTFIGHGSIAMIGNEQWLPYLGLVGIDGPIAYQAMFFIGVVDWVVAFSCLLRPSKYVLVYATVWAFSAALARPLVGESWLAFVERAANWAAPLALLLILFVNQVNFKEAFQGTDR